MFAQFTKFEKSIFAKLVQAGHNVYCSGRGWTIENDVYESYAVFFEACKKLAK